MDARDVSATRDLDVSVGEVAVSFSTFDLYVGLADRPEEAVAAARSLDEQLSVLQQAGSAAVHGHAVFYADGVVVPASAGRLATACLDGAEAAATMEMSALADALPTVELPRAVESRFLARCRRIGAAASCGCAYRRAARLYPFGQVDRASLQMLAGVLRTCEVRGGRL
jgi:hypothetical protein